MSFDLAEFVKIWVIEFAGEWTGCYQALTKLCPQTSESWRMLRANELAADPEVLSLKEQYITGDKRAELLPDDVEFKLYLWELSKKSAKDADRLKAAELFGNVMGYIKKENTSQTLVNNVMIMPAEKTVDDWEALALNQQSDLKNGKLIEHG